MPHKDRIERLQKNLSQQQCDALLIEDPTNLYYLTGLEVSTGKLVVGSKDANLFVDNRYFELCKKNSPTRVYLIETSSVDEPLSREELRWIKTLAFDSSRTTHKAYLELTSMSARLEIKLVALDDPLYPLRLIKDRSEVIALTEAGALGSAGYDYVLTLLKDGVTEEEIARELEIFWKRRGSKTIAFDPIIAFGAHSSMPHYRAGNGVLKSGDIVLIDIGVNYKHYHSDMTRVVFFGNPDPRLQEIYQVVKDAQEKALELCTPGTLIGDLDKAARQHIISKGFGDFFTHSLGHGVGLDIHEAPWLRNRPPSNSQPLENGMVITVEPGIYLPGIGGVRIEDCIVINSNGYENLTNRSKELTVI